MSHPGIVKLRPLNRDTDLPRLSELYMTAMVEPEPVTVEDLQTWLQNAPPGRILQFMVAIDERERIVGFGNVGRDAWMAPGRFWIEVVVDPAFCKQGIGSLLYTHAFQFAQEHGATSLKAELRDSLVDALKFAKWRNFKVDRYIFESTLDLATFDETRFDDVIERVEATGIRFFTLADIGDTRDAQYKLYEINRRYAFDIPGSDSTFAPFEEFHKQVFEAHWYRADGQIVAADGDKWIGLSAVGYFPESNYMYNMMTGVEPSYRGRNIALALKLLVVRCARKYGVSYLRTNNDSENMPILAVNRKLGYQPQPGKYVLLCNL